MHRTYGGGPFTYELLWTPESGHTDDYDTEVDGRAMPDRGVLALVPRGS